MALNAPPEAPGRRLTAGAAWPGNCSNLEAGLRCRFHQVTTFGPERRDDVRNAGLVTMRRGPVQDEWKCNAMGKDRARVILPDAWARSGPAE
jgi:hypothetical protein